MLPISYNRRLVKLGFFFFTFLASQNTAIAKKKQVASVAPITQKKASESDDDKTVTKAKLQSEQSELEAENALNRARLEKQFSTVMAEIQRLRIQKERKGLEKDLEDSEVRNAHDKAMLLLNMEKEKLAMELELAQAKFMKQMEQYNIQLIKIDKQIQLERGQAQLFQETTHRLKSEIETLQAKITRDNHIEKKPIYLKNPLTKKTNVLILSDRSIELNGRITPWKANYITDQIHYFNNKNSEYPIFLVINDSPGGSVNAGWNILQAIEHSKAPVYVVVKAFAASMAAVITTLATRSYVYPNAEILHHQPRLSGFSSGNVRHTKEIYKELNEAWKRLGGRVAKKMGISLKAFEKKLYEKSMHGDWTEYGNNAKKIKWVDYVINGIQQTGISSLPDPNNYSFQKFLEEYFGSDKIKNGVVAGEESYYDSLAPHDFNYSYNPDKKLK